MSRPTYYPGTPTRPRATALSFLTGEAGQAPDFRIEKKLGWRVQGKLGWIPRAQPNVRTTITLDAPGPDEFTVDVAADGSFEFNGLPGSVYEIIVSTEKNRTLGTFILTGDISNMVVRPPNRLR